MNCTPELKFCQDVNLCSVRGEFVARVILHSDLNGFYASVEIMQNPNLRGKCVAVCGSTKDRHGIVLAKSEEAKKFGIKTGMTNGDALRLCPGLILVPPNYKQYLKYSYATRKIYERFSDLVEPFGMDECWIDISKLTDDGEEVAHIIRNTVKSELGLTVSIGVSYNKVFAKLGSDMKKPDAVTVIGKDDIQKVWALPASDLLYVGRATQRKFDTHRIHTIGDIAKAGSGFLISLLGKWGGVLHTYAMGQDISCVNPDRPEAKSVGRGVTCTSDLQDETEVWRVLLELCQEISHKLIAYGLWSSGVQLTIKDSKLTHKQFQSPLELCTQTPMDLARCAFKLFKAHYTWNIPVRALSVRAINLFSNPPVQADLFCDHEAILKRDSLTLAVDNLRCRFGKHAVRNAGLLFDLKMPTSGAETVILPSFTV